MEKHNSWKYSENISAFLRNKPTISENANLAGSAGCTENLKENKTGKKEDKPSYLHLKLPTVSIVGPQKKQLKVCYFTKNSPSLKWTKQTETKLPSIQQFGQFVSFSLQMHALWTALTFKSWNALWDTILKIGDEPWPTTTLVPSMCFTHMTQGDLAPLFENLSYRKNAKASKNIFLYIVISDKF